MVGAVRFELTTSCTRNKRATRLRYAPTQGQEKVPGVGPKCNVEFRKFATLSTGAQISPCTLRPPHPHPLLLLGGEGDGNRGRYFGAGVHCAKLLSELSLTFYHAP